MMWAIYCMDDLGAGALREQHGAAHREHLMASKAQLLFAGALQTDDGSAATGTLLIVQADSRDAAQRLVDADPFKRCGVFGSVTVTSLRKGLWNHEALQGL